MQFKKYMHLERLGRCETDGILEKPCYILPKLDGSNASIWHDGEKVCFGSRNHDLTNSHKSFRGFKEWINLRANSLENLFMGHDSEIILYGEWLVPHTIKCYSKKAWKQFYIFDIWCKDTGFIPHPVVQFICMQYDLPYVPIICEATETSFDKLEVLKNCNWLLTEGGKHEGLVIKRHDFVNKYGMQVYAKYVPESLKQKAAKRKEIFKLSIEEGLANDFVTDHLLSKELSKVCSGDIPTTEHIPKFLGFLWHVFVIEEIWPILKKFKNPVIDFKKLKKLVEAKARDFLLNKIEGGNND